MIALVLIAISTLVIAVNIVHAGYDKIYVAFIWHYHQPWYYSPDESYFTLPWVRMHSVGNYYKMAYILSKYPQVKVTFTFSGSLLEQLVDYVENGKMDKRQVISWRLVNGTITVDDVFDMLRIPGGFFDINWARIVEKSPRFKELRDLAQSLHNNCSKTATSDIEYKNCVVNGFTGGNLTSQNVIDLAVLFNLLWIDPQVAREKYPDIYGLMQKAYNETQPGFTLSNLTNVLNVHVDVMSSILPLYSQLSASGQVELIPVPYSHPLAPILADAGLSEDLEVHVRLGINLFQSKLGVTPRGVWPAEQAVNEYVVRAFKKAGVNWTVSDQTILGATGIDTSSIENLGVPWYIDFPEGRIYIVFRELDLSNKISFQYANWDQDQAVNDLVNKLMSYRNSAQGPRLVVIALDGENPWEHYPEFGDVFLNKLYSKLVDLQNQGVVVTTTPWEFISSFPNTAKQSPEKQYTYLDLAGRDISDLPANSYGDAYSSLPTKTVTARLPEGSWSGGALATWIGDRQENVAFMWMIKAREDVMRKLGVSSFSELYSNYPSVAKYILKAQASDWWWWYGGDGGGSPATFDPIFKSYLARAYSLAGLTPPQYLNVTAYPDGRPIGTINQAAPQLVDTPPSIDGVIEDTWDNLVSANKALLISVGSTLQRAYIALDQSNLYFAFKLNTQSLSSVKIGVYFATPVVNMTPYGTGYNVYPRGGSVDLGIHLAREIYIDPASKTAVISKANGSGGWSTVKTISNVPVAGSPGNYSLELSTGILDVELAPGQPAYLAIVLYVDNNPAEWSSRLGLAYFLSIPQPPPGAGGVVVLDMVDPVGDDDGPGGYGYPSNPVFQPGVFDLTRFTMVDTGGSVLFRFAFRNLGGNPWNGPNGWSLQYIHVYVKTTLSAEGRKDTFGLNVTISHGWHFAILAAPGWGSDPVPQGERTALYYYDKDTPVVQDSVLKAYADQATYSIYVEVSKSILYDPENIGRWTIAVLITSYDGYSPTKVRAFVIGGGEWAVNVTSNYSLAVLKGVLPLVLDVLAPTAQEQYQMLNSFNVTTGEQAKVYGVTPPPPTTTTPPPTTTTTTTPPETTTSPTTTTTTTITVTTPPPQTTTTPPETTTSPTTTTITTTTTPPTETTTPPTSTPTSTPTQTPTSTPTYTPTTTTTPVSITTTSAFTETTTLSPITTTPSPSPGSPSPPVTTTPATSTTSLAPPPTHPSTPAPDITGIAVVVGVVVVVAGLALYYVFVRRRPAP